MMPSRSPALRLRLVGALAALLLGANAAPARAGLVITVLDSTAFAGGTGTFDITITNTGLSAVNISGFSVEPTVPSIAGVLFTGVSTSTALPYIFAAAPGPPPFSFDTFPNTDFTASDTYFAAPGFQVLGAGDTLGLAHVLYSVDPTIAPGTVVPVRLDLTGTQLTDVNSNPLAFSAVNGQILVAVRAVPEPSAVLLVGLGGGFLLLRRRRALRGAIAS